MIDNDNITIFENEVERIIVEFCERYEVDKKKIPPNKWKLILKKIRNELIQPNRQRLLLDERNHWAYDKDKFMCIYELYKDISIIYNQEISLYNLQIFIGITYDSIKNMSNNIKAFELLTTEGIDILGMIKQDNEQSIYDLMLNDDFKRQNGYLAKLNAKYKWNMPEKRQSEQLQVAVISSAELPKLAKKEE